MTKQERLTIIMLQIIILLSLFFIPGVMAEEKGPGGVYSLDESIREAFENNWGIKEKEENVEEKVYAEKQAKADFLPTFSTSYSYTRLGEATTISSPAFAGISGGGGELEIGTQDNYQWTGTVSQPLFTGFALTSSYELAKLGIDQSKMDLELERLDLALKVKEAYFNILRTEKAVDVAKSAVESLEAHLEVAEHFYDVGMIPINDLLKAEVELANARQDLIAAGNSSSLAKASFNNLLARPLDSEVRVEDILYYRPQRGDLEECFDTALESRPEIKALEINGMQVDQQIKLAKSKYYPEVALTYNYTKEGDTPEVSGSPFHEADSWQAVLGLSWTFWDWGKTRYSVRENQSLRRQLVQTKENLKDGIKLEIKRAVLDLQEAEQNIPTAKKSVEQAEENLRVGEERFKAQVATSTDVLDAQTLLSQARVNYYNALYDHNLAKAALLRAIGEY